MFSGPGGGDLADRPDMAILEGLPGRLPGFFVIT